MHKGGKSDHKKDWQKIKEAAEQQEYQNEEEMDNNVEEGEEAESISEAALEHPSYIALEEKLTLAEQKAHENWEKSVRALAELENVRRRSEREVANAHRYGAEKLITALLPVLDSLEQAIQLVNKENQQNMYEGLELTMKLFLDVLEKNQVEQIDPQDALFNPQEHEAMAVQEADIAPNTVLTVFQKGYKLNDRLIRPARVIVSKAKS